MGEGELRRKRLGKEIDRSWAENGTYHEPG